jgi:predicted ferric reductase
MIFLLLVLVVPVTIVLDTPLGLLAKNSAALVYSVQRFLGLIAFVLLFVQIVLGAFMSWWTEKFGPWIFKFHVLEGISAYILILLHPVFFALFNYFGGRGLDPIGVFLGFCVLCKPQIEFYYTLGRISFWLATVAVFAGLLRASTPWLRANWRKLHVLNYVTFLIIGAHGFFAGTDFAFKPFIVFAAPAYLFIVYIVVFKKFPELYSSYKAWLKN